LSLFFFQAEDGIRDYKVTGVQTCALPISPVLDGFQLFLDKSSPPSEVPARDTNQRPLRGPGLPPGPRPSFWRAPAPEKRPDGSRSEERRVGKECGAWGSASTVKITLKHMK